MVAAFPYRLIVIVFMKVLVTVTFSYLMTIKQWSIDQRAQESFSELNNKWEHMLKLYNY